MRIAVIGATGRIGQLTAARLDAARHEVVPINRSAGVDAYTGTGLEAALAGVDAVVDTSNTAAHDEAVIVDFFSTTTHNLLAAEQSAGVGHHVVLSIVGIDNGQAVAHYAGKRVQERIVAASELPYSIVRATQFHDFPAMTASWTERDGSALVAPLLLQPIAPADVAGFLADIATGSPLQAVVDIAGPETQDLVDMARRTLAARGRHVHLVPTWRGIFGTDMAGEVLLPGPDARIGRTTFDEWLRAQESPHHVGRSARETGRSG